MYKRNSSSQKPLAINYSNNHEARRALAECRRLPMTWSYGHTNYVIITYIYIQQTAFYKEYISSTILANFIMKKAIQSPQVPQEHS